MIDVWLFLAVPWGCLQFAIVIFPDHAHYYFCNLHFYYRSLSVLPKFEVTVDIPSYSLTSDASISGKVKARQVFVQNN